LTIQASTGLIHWSNPVLGLYPIAITVTDPYGAESISACTPIYESHPGWSESTLGIQSFDKLPKNAQDYLRRLEELVGTRVALVSTGPDRNETIVLHHPFD
jgi:adenylosuccinate synthase